MTRPRKVWQATEGSAPIYTGRVWCIVLYIYWRSFPPALNKAGQQSQAAHLLEQLAENAITENRYTYLYTSSG